MTRTNRAPVAAMILLVAAAVAAPRGASSSRPTSS
jgi:hypothetical protein